MKIDNFKGPYISHEPEIQIHNIEKNDKYLVLTTNGVWEQLSKNDVFIWKKESLLLIGDTNCWEKLEW